ncbi:hypothetical protein STEG23_023207, partial [Scotinomys teguina]
NRLVMQQLKSTVSLEMLVWAGGKPLVMAAVNSKLNRTFPFQPSKPYTSGMKDYIPGTISQDKTLLSSVLKLLFSGILYIATRQVLKRLAPSSEVGALRIHSSPRDVIVGDEESENEFGKLVTGICKTLEHLGRLPDSHSCFM